MGVMSAVALGFLFAVVIGLNEKTFSILLLVIAIIPAFQFQMSLLQPKLAVIKKVKALDKDMLFALRHLLIKVRSGITLFDSMKDIAKGSYGQVSKEFDKITIQITAGKNEVEALEGAAYRNPSPFFRRAVWQIASSMRAGADIGSTLKNIVRNLSEEQRILIRKYGAELNPFSLMYMMVTVIMPTLGIALLIVLSSFTGLPIGPEVFIGIYVVLLIFQYMFMGMIKTRRPAIGI